VGCLVVGSVFLVASRDSNPESLHVGGFGLWYLPEGEMTEMRGAAVRLMGARGSEIVSVGVAVAGEVFPGRGSVLELLWEHLGVYFVTVMEGARLGLVEVNVLDVSCTVRTFLGKKYRGWLGILSFSPVKDGDWALCPELVWISSCWV